MMAFLQKKGKTKNKMVISRKNYTVLKHVPFNNHYQYIKKKKKTVHGVQNSVN